MAVVVGLRASGMLADCLIFLGAEGVGRQGAQLIGVMWMSDDGTTSTRGPHNDKFTPLFLRAVLKSPTHNRFNYVIYLSAQPLLDQFFSSGPRVRWKRLQLE